MNRLFAALAFLLCATAFAEKLQRPTGFLGVAFGSAPAEVVRILGSRGGATVPEEMPSTFDKLELAGGNFAGQEVVKWKLEFVNRKFAAATVTLKTEGNAMAVYQELKQSLVAKYGPVASEKKAGKSDADKRRAAQGNNNGTRRDETFGKVAFWKFAPTLADKGRTLIVCSAVGADGYEVTDESKLQVSLQYIDETLMPDASKRLADPGAKAAPPVKKEDL
jgi:hypothetical protein